MGALLTTLLPILLKYLLPLISAWFAARGHAALAGNLAASPDQFTQLYGAWGGIAAGGIGIGEAISWWSRKSAAGPISPENWKKIVELILQLIVMFLTPEQASKVNTAISAAFPDEARHLGIRR